MLRYNSVNRNKRTKYYHPYVHDEDINDDMNDNKLNKLSKNSNPLKKIFNFGDDDTDVYRESNHIYFKTDVNTA